MNVILYLEQLQMFTFRTALIVNSKPENTTRNKKLVLFRPAGQRLVAGMASVRLQRSHLLLV